MAYEPDETKEKQDKKIVNGNQCKTCTEDSTSKPERITAKSVFESLFQETCVTFKHFSKPQQLLLTALQFQAGFIYSFVISELTRAYISCVYGVSMIGICMSAFGASSFLSSLLAGKLSGKIGRKYVVAVGYLAACSFYLFGLLWIPRDDSSIGVAFGISVLAGFVDAFIRTMSSEVTLAHFLDEKKTAYICWFVWMTMGMLTQNAWSTSVCVREKLYVMLATTTFAAITYGIAEHLHEKKEKRSTSFSKF